MPDLLARSDYHVHLFDRTSALLLVAVVVFAVAVAAVAWGLHGRPYVGGHAADRPKPAPWVNDRYRNAAAWLARNDQAQRELADARRGGEER